jgi:hypothetical protein
MTARLEELKPDVQVRGLKGREAVRVVSAEMMGDSVFSSSWCGDP